MKQRVIHVPVNRPVDKTVGNADNPCENDPSGEMHGIVEPKKETAPAGNRGLAHQSEYAERGLLHMVEHPTTSAPTDGCPNCLTRGHQPRTVTDDTANEIPGHTATYRCTGCGFTWRTTWATGWGDA